MDDLNDYHGDRIGLYSHCTRKGRRVSSAAGFLGHGAEHDSNEAILDAFRRLATCGLHATGSCRMGGDAASVVDPSLRVRGVDGLRIADCSVMPTAISGNTSAPAMALGYRAATLPVDEYA